MILIFNTPFFRFIDLSCSNIKRDVAYSPAIAIHHFPFSQNLLKSQHLQNIYELYYVMTQPRQNWVLYLGNLSRDVVNLNSTVEVEAWLQASGVAFESYRTTSFSKQTNTRAHRFLYIHYVDKRSLERAEDYFRTTATETLVVVHQSLARGTLNEPLIQRQVMPLQHFQSSGHKKNKKKNKNSNYTSTIVPHSSDDVSDEATSEDEDFLSQLSQSISNTRMR